MRLLFISNLYPPLELGGYEQWCQEVANRFRARGHDVQILTSNYRADELTTWETHVHRTLHLQADIHHYEPLHFLTRFQEEEVANKAALKRVVSAFRPDLILVWGMWNLSPSVAYWAETLMPDRVAYFVSSYWPADVDMHLQYWQLPANHTLGRWVKRPLRALANRQLEQNNYPPQLQFQHVRCCSHYVRDTLCQQNKIPTTAEVLLGGIDPTPFTRPSNSNQAAGNNKLRLLFAGRLVEDKGAHTAVEALGLLRQQNQAADLELTILGGGHPGYEVLLHDLATENQVAAHIKFCPQVPREEIPNWMQQHDIFLFTSIWPEPMARVVMEAMAAGLLVIGSEVGGQTEMLANEVNSLTFAPGDAQQLSQRILRLQQDPALLPKLAQAGQQLVLEQFTLTRMVDDLEAWLQSITTENKFEKRQLAVCQENPEWYADKHGLGR